MPNIAASVLGEDVRRGRGGPLEKSRQARQSLGQLTGRAMKGGGFGRCERRNGFLQYKQTTFAHVQKCGLCAGSQTAV